MNDIWIKEVEEKIKRNNQILFDRESTLLKELLEKIRMQKHTTIITWVFICMKEPLKRIKEKHSKEIKPQVAVNLAKEWASGNIKMKEAKDALLEVHAVAKTTDDKEDIALYHAIGQGCSVVHVETHAIGLVIYELTAIIRKYGLENSKKQIEDKMKYYIEQLDYCEKNIDKNKKWAKFLMDDKKQNKEKLLYEKNNKM